MSSTMSAPLQHVSLDFLETRERFLPVKAEAILSEKKITAETIAEAAQAAMDAVTPIDDVRGSARYRKFMVRNLVREGVTEVWAKLSK